MATPGADISSLTPAQQETLQNYTAVTDQNVEAAIPLLQRCEWNLQIAITRFFDGEPATDPLAEARAAQPQDVRRQENLMQSLGSSNSRRAIPNLEPAPRIVPQPESQIALNPIFSIVSAPFSALYVAVSRVLGPFGYLFPFLPRLFRRLVGTTHGTARRNASGRVALKPRDAAARFIREFAEEYGPNTLPFFENGYAQALDAAKKDLKFLLVVLLSPEHDDTSSYVRETLLAPSVVSYVSDPTNNVLLWVGDVQDSEAFQVSTALSTTKFPFAAVICHTPAVSSTAMSIVGRMVGPMTAQSFLSKIQRATEQYAPGLTQTRRARQEAEASRSLRVEQESAYERSLAADREKARRKKEAQEQEKKAAEEAARAEHEKDIFERNLAQWRRHRAGRLAPEPSADIKDAVRISLRLGDGERLVRKFAANAEMEEVYAFVECYDLLNDEDADLEGVDAPDNFTHSYNFRLVSPMPREVYEVDAKGTLKEKIGRSANLLVEKLIPDDDDEEEEEEEEDEEEDVK
ncbi:ubx domain containing protein [Venturia nashicola]|uniref:Ubx domain containing protein n=1 Tax=Venturia nashicola TaxID=86259 RepID=A0A4Z1NT76_9PEZI|nr:ubx domain containing protein [Venturia nashicola]